MVAPKQKKTPLRITLYKLRTSWQIQTSDGRAWYASRKPFGSGLSRTRIRRVYPTVCAKLREVGDSVSFFDTKGIFERGRSK